MTLSWGLTLHKHKEHDIAIWLYKWHEMEPAWHEMEPAWHEMEPAKYLHIRVNHEVEPVEIEVSGLAVKSVFDSVKAIRHYLLHAILPI